MRSGYCYLQQIKNLENKHPNIYQTFLDGFHVVHRCNQCWAGLSGDIVTKQTLMCSLKSTGGVPRGCGMAKNMRNHWTCCTCNIWVQHWNSGYHKSTTQRINWSMLKKRCIRSWENSPKAWNLFTLYIGEDIDLLILLLPYSTRGSNTIYFHSDSNNDVKERKVYNIKGTWTATACSDNFT